MVIVGVVRRGLASAWLATTATALLCALVSVGIARRGALSLAELFSVGDLLVYFATLALSLLVGLRFALPSAAAE